MSCFPEGLSEAALLWVLQRRSNRPHIHLTSLWFCSVTHTSSHRHLIFAYCGKTPLDLLRPRHKDQLSASLSHSSTWESCSWHGLCQTLQFCPHISFYTVSSTTSKWLPSFPIQECSSTLLPSSAWPHGQCLCLVQQPIWRSHKLLFAPSVLHRVAQVKMVNLEKKSWFSQSHRPQTDTWRTKRHSQQIPLSSNTTKARIVRCTPAVPRIAQLDVVWKLWQH